MNTTGQPSRITTRALFETSPTRERSLFPFNYARASRMLYSLLKNHYFVLVPRLESRRNPQEIKAKRSYESSTHTHFVTIVTTAIKIRLIRAQVELGWAGSGSISWLGWDSTKFS